MTEPLCKWCGTPQYVHNTDFTCGINTKGWGHRWDIRTEPRRKELFDEEKFQLLTGRCNYTGSHCSTNFEDLKIFIQSEIQRNRKEAVREFAEKLKKKVYIAMIDAALKERGVE